MGTPDDQPRDMFRGLDEAEADRLATRFGEAAGRLRRRGEHGTAADVREAGHDLADEWWAKVRGRRRDAPQD